MKLSGRFYQGLRGGQTAGYGDHFRLQNISINNYRYDVLVVAYEVI
jgi:hypothetical protein